MSALEAVYICLYFFVAPLVALVFTVEKFPEPLKIFAKSDGLGGRDMEAILRRIWFYLHKEFCAAGIRFYLHKEFRAVEIRLYLHKDFRMPGIEFYLHKLYIPQMFLRAARGL